MWDDRPARSTKVLASLSFVLWCTQCTWLMGDLPDPIENVVGESGGGGEEATPGGRDSGAVAGGATMHDGGATAGSATEHDGGAGGARPVSGGTAGALAVGGTGEVPGGAGSDESGGTVGSTGGASGGAGGSGGSGGRGGAGSGGAGSGGAGSGGAGSGGAGGSDGSGGGGGAGGSSGTGGSGLGGSGGSGGSGGGLGGGAMGGAGTAGLSSGGSGGSAPDCDEDDDGHDRDDGVCTGTDCDDADRNVHPGQTTYFTTARGDGGFDYDCDGEEELDDAPSVDCSLLGISDCSGEGYGGAPPDCGESGDWVRCSPAIAPLPLVCTAEDDGQHVRGCR